MDGFKVITDQYRKKHYPNGFFARMAKKSGGIVIAICGVVLALMGILVAAAPVSFVVEILKGEMKSEGNVVPIIVFLIFALILLVPGIFFVQLGIRRKMRGRDGWMQKCAETSDYPESVVQDFESQFGRTDAMICYTDPAGTFCALTTDYIMSSSPMSPCLMKISDIAGAYLASLSYTYYVGNRMRTGHTLNLAIFSNHKTLILMPSKKERAEYLVSLLKEKNPDIDTADGIVLSEDQYQALLDKIRK